MSCEHLICASCAGRVAEGRCASCRTSRAEVHSHGPSLTAPFAFMLALIVLLAVFLALHGH